MPVLLAAPLEAYKNDWLVLTKPRVARLPWSHNHYARVTMFLLLTVLGATFLGASAVQAASVAFFNPTDNGGSWLDNAGDGLGEPLNVRSTLCDIQMCSDLGVFSLSF